MRLVAKYYPKLEDQQMSIIEELSFHTTKLYNIANYECREKEYKSYVTLEKELNRIGITPIFILIRINNV
ncbi:hypothetical protein [Paenibacillus senegalensis]|uniref:hypothetical protein n=1 Tax=Paenibacillus senegalensis TaxID=1465766 RepID=UPI00028995A3|nr:hypothetical protein [Paenibacillus senegalensis]